MLGSAPSAAGNPSLATTGLTLRAGKAPDEPALFFLGPERSWLPLGSGRLCLGGGLIPYRSSPVAGGRFQSTVDFATYGATFAAQGTVPFPCWYRDPDAFSFQWNSSYGLEFVFVP